MNSATPHASRGDSVVPEDGAHVRPDAASAGLGARLLSERRAQGLSLGDIARQLKLSVKQVEALEHDDYSTFPGPVFVRGFLRNYAKLLGLELGGLMPTASASGGMKPVAETEYGPDSDNVRGWPGGMRTLVVILGVVLLAAGLVVLAKRSGRGEQPATTPGVRGPLAVTAQAPAARPHGSPLIVGNTPAQPHNPGPEAPLGSTGLDLLTGRPPAPAAASANTLPSADTPSADSAVREVAMAAGEPIRLVFDDESWVEITDGSGEVVFSRLNESGSTRVIKGVPPFNVVIGNARGVQLYFQDERIDLAPYTRIDVARVVLE